MKKIVFGFLVLASLYFLIRVIWILLFGLSRLTEWGYGYLTGSFLFLVIFSGLTVFFGYRIFRSG